MKVKLFFVFVLITIVGVFGEAVFAIESKMNMLEREKTLIICRVSDNPKKHVKDLKPIVEYVAGKLAHVGITKGKVLFAKDNRQLVNYLRQGKVDWVTETPFSAVKFEKYGGAEILLLRWKKGVEKYCSLFITRKDSSVENLDDLVGKKIAFEDRGSTSGFLLPASVIVDQGVDIAELSGPRDEALKDKAGFFFAQGELNISNLVYRGIADAGVLSNLDWEETDRINIEMKKEMRVFYQTPEVPRALELVRGNMPSMIKEELKKVLIAAHTDPDAKEALKEYKKTSQFEELDEAADESLEEIRKLSELLSADLMIF